MSWRRDIKRLRRLAELASAPDEASDPGEIELREVAPGVYAAPLGAVPTARRARPPSRIVRVLDDAQSALEGLERLGQEVSRWRRE